MAQIEYVADLDGRRDVGDAQVVSFSAVDANGDSDHGGIVTVGDGHR